MNEANAAQVLVVGAGPTGLVAGCVLARAGVSVRVIDKAPLPSETSRALAIFPRTLELFEKLGVLDEILTAGVRMSGMTVHLDAHEPVRVGFERLPPPFPFALSLPQSETERILRLRLTSLGVGVERGMELVGFAQDADGVRVVIRDGSLGREQQTYARWMVGCDGAHSSVRHILGARFEGEHTRDRFILADVKVSTPYAADEAQLFLSGEGVLVMVPLRGGRARVIANRPPAAASHGEGLELTDFQEAVRRRASPKIELSAPEWMSQFSITRRQVRQFREGHVFLAGDAAHIHSPVGGQGMNTGIQDAFNLGWKLALSMQGVATPLLLSSYSEEREPVARGVLRFTDRITRLITMQNPLARRLRNGVLPLLLSQRRLEQAFLMRISQMGLRYRKSSVVADYSGEPLRAGDRAPDGGLLEAASGEMVRLFERYRDQRHVLVVFTGLRDGEEVREEVHEIRSVIQSVFSKVISLTIVETETLLPILPGTLLDHQGAVHRLYDADAGGLVLVRPDGVIAFRSSWERAEKLWGYLALCFNLVKLS